jgi:hypothetical protein
MIGWLRDVWHSHGTKVLGFATAAVGLIEYVDSATINLVGSFLGPKWGPVASKGLQVAAGLMVAHRGYMNTNRNRPPPPIP